MSCVSDSRRSALESPFVNFEQFTNSETLFDSRSCQTLGVLQQSWRVSHWTKTKRFCGILTSNRDKGLDHEPNCRRALKGPVANRRSCPKASACSFAPGTATSPPLKPSLRA